MCGQIKSDLFDQKKRLSVIFLSYTVFALIFAFAYRFAMNPDGTSVLRLAGYLAEGNFMRSVSSGYSPLFTWLVAFFILLGFEGLVAARTALALCGAGLVFCVWLLSFRFNMQQKTRFVAVLTATPLIAFWTIQFISPDVIFAAFVVLYIYMVSDPVVLTSKKTSFLCGLAAGFSYLSHHYAFPFFMVHFPLILLTRWYLSDSRKTIAKKEVMRAWGVGVAGFFIIASIWVGTLSLKYGELIISPKGGIAHAIMGPADKDRRHPFFVSGLFNPRDDYAIHVFEDISDVQFESWSPFESREYFIHQLKVIKNNAVSIRDHFITNSPFFNRTFVLIILALFPLVLWLNPSIRRNKFLYIWVIITFTVYSSGFLLLIARSPRRFYALMLIFMLLAFYFMEELRKGLRDRLPGMRSAFSAVFIFPLLAGAFALKPCMNFIKAAGHVINVEQVNPYEEIARAIEKVDFPAPYAVIRTSQKPTTDYYIAYFLGKQLLGRPVSNDVQGITKELCSAGGRSLLVFDKPDLVSELMLDKRYVHMASIALNSIRGSEYAAGWIVTKHEIINGWDKTVDVFRLR